MSWVALGVAGGTAAVKLATGAIQNSKANSIDNNNQFPNQAVDPIYQQNVNQATQMAQEGMPAQQHNNSLNLINRNQGSGLQALQRSANPGANLVSLVRAGNDATNGLNAQDAAMRNQNLLKLLQERQILAQQKDKAWDWNYQQKYLGNLAKANALRGSSNANINSGLNELGGTGLTGAKLGAFNSNGGKVVPGTTGGGVEAPLTDYASQYDNQSGGFNSFLGY